MAQQPISQRLGAVPSIPGYRIEREIGRGGQAVVYEAFQASTQRKVAIKFLRHGQHSAANELARLEREGAVLSTVRHPQVVGVIDRGVAENSAYLVMELVHGEPFDTWARSAWRPANEGGASERQRRVLEAFAKVCSGVEAAHEEGIVHRDLKPSNVLVDHAGEPHVLDFGVARSFGDASGAANASRPDATITVTGEFIGSMPWASPEQVLGQTKPGPGSDVYALGVMLYQALTGEFPYDVTGATSDVMRNITSVQPPPPGRVVSARLSRLAERDADGSRPAPAPVSNELDTIALKALAKRTEDRYATAGALGEDLTRYLRGETPTAVAEESRRSMKRLGKSAAIAGAGLAVLAVLAIFLGPRVWKYLASGAGDSRSGGAGSQSVAQTQPRLVAPRIAVAVRNNFPLDLPAPLPNPGQPVSNMAMSQTVFMSPGGSDLRGIRSCTFETRGARGSYSAMAISPDGKQLAVGSDEGTIRILDAETGEVVRLLVGHRGALCDLSWSVNGQLASCDQNAVWVWDTATGKPLHYYAMRTESVAWSPDGKTLAFGTGSILLVSPSQAQVMRDLGKYPGNVFRLRWSPDGTKLAGGCGDNSVLVWDAKTGTLLHTLKGHTNQVHHIAWMADGVLCSSDWTSGRMVRWNFTNGQSSPLIPDSSSLAWGPGARFIFSPDETRVLCSPGFAQATILNRTDGSVVANLKGHTDWVTATAWSPDATAVYTASQDRSVAKWSASNGARAWVTQGQQGSFYTCAVSPDGKSLAATGYPNDIWILDCETAEPRSRYSAGNGPGSNPFYALDWSPDGSTVAATNDGRSLRRFSSTEGELEPLAFEETVRGASYSPDGERLAFSVGSNLVVWDTRKNVLVKSMPLKERASPALAWSPTGKHIALALPDSIKIALVDLETDEVVTAVQHVWSKMVWLPDGGSVYAPYHGATVMQVPDLKSLVSPVFTGGGYALAAVWSPNGEMAAFALDAGQIAVLNKTLKGRIMTLDGGGGICDLAWARDGKLLAEASRYDAMVRFWEMPEGKPRGTFVPMSDGLWVRIGADGRWSGPRGVADKLLVYVITEDGERLTLPIAEFEKRFGVKTGEERGDPMPVAPVRKSSTTQTIPAR